MQMSGTEYIIRGVPFELVEQFWKFAEPFVKRALDHTHGEMTHLDLMQMCLDRNAQLWLIYHNGRVVGAGTTEIAIYPQKKVCRIITLAGTEFDEWMGMAHDIVSVWAKGQGCQAMQALTRTGFVPKLKSIGYRNRYCICDKPLE